MSLTQFVKRPAIREAFKALAIRQRTPLPLRRSPLHVKSHGKYHQLVGTAFDYLARFHVARELRRTEVQVRSGRWVSVYCEHLLLVLCSGVHKHEVRWRNGLARAKASAGHYMAGKGNLTQLATLSQYLAQADLVYRCGWFDPEFQPVPEVTDELLRLVELFDPVRQFAPKQICLLNPAFSDSPKVGGADAHLLIDDLLIDIKTMGKLQVTLDHLIQLAGYAALQRMGGILVDEQVYPGPLEEVAIYFGRHAVLARWRLHELFPAEGFERFREIFDNEIEAVEREHQHPQ